jgi:hypothetical protein
MKSIINTTLQLLLSGREKELWRAQEEASFVQEEQLAHLLRRGAGTHWGREHGYDARMGYEQFADSTPLSSYEDLYPWIERAYKGEADVLWPGVTTKFAKSSGTTNARSKYIPMTDESLGKTHYQGGKDMWLLYFAAYPDAAAHLGKSVGIGGSLDEPPRAGVQVGDLSAVMMANLPKWAEWRRAPEKSIAMMPNWDEKLGVMAESLQAVDVRSLAGVPTWTLLLIDEILERSGKDSVYDVWPKLEVFFHGAVAFDPYRAVFAERLGPAMRYLELYNASEGFFGIQDDMGRPNEMLLMLDYGMFYEFVARDQEDATPITIADVEVGVPYEIVITTNGGLWRYRIGDVIKFTSVSPYRIKIGGRTKHYINTFGEELMVGNAEVAVAEASEATGALVAEYTAGPQYLEGSEAAGYHEWIFEFKREPDDKNKFVEVLDAALGRVNSDYAAKRRGDRALSMPKLHIVPQGTFRRFLESRGPITGRNKVPRLANHRDFLEKLLQ